MFAFCGTLGPECTPLGESRFVESRSLLLKMNINSRLKGAVDRELGGEFIEKKYKFSIFDGVAEQLFF